VDEDDCLSVEDILLMINRIERNFCKESVRIDIDSYSLLQEIAYRTAQRKF